MASYEIDNNINNVVITEEPAEEVTPNYNTPAPTGNGGEAKSDMVGQLKKGSALDWAPTTFVSFGKVNRTTTAELASKIHAAFGATFHDLLGAAINIDPKGNFKLELLFEQNTEKCPSGKITNLVGLTCATGANSFFAKNQIIQNRVNNKAYTLNAETKMLLAEFMCGGAKANKYTDAKKWDSHISQVPIPVSAYRDPYYRGGDRIAVRLEGLDLHRVLSKLYGNRMVISSEINGDGEYENTTVPARYEVHYISSITPTNHIININQFDVGAVQTYVARENPQMIYNAGLVYY